MSLSATYASAASFTVATDRTADFPPGRAVKANCGVDGYKYGFVSYSAYSSSTTVYLLDAESDDLTSNLTEVDFGIPIPDSANKGNISLFDRLAIRGKQQIAVSYKDSDEISLSAGMIHIDDGTYERAYYSPGFDKQLTGLSASTWYAIYVKPPANGLLLSATEVEYSTTMPGYVAAKQGWYHGTNTTWRCIGFVYSDGSSAVSGFYRNGLMNIYGTAIRDDNETNNPSNVWTDATLTVPGVDGILAIVMVRGYYINLTTYLLARKNGTSDSGILIADVATSTQFNYSQQVNFIPCDSSGKIEIKWNASTTNTVGIDTKGFILPNGIYNP